MLQVLDTAYVQVLNGFGVFPSAESLAREYLARMLNRNAVFIDPAFVSDRR